MRGWLRSVSVVSAAGLVVGLLSVVGVVVSAGPAVAATDPGCTTLGGDDTTVPGTCVVSLPVVVGAAPVTVSEHLLFESGAAVTLSGASLTLNVVGVR